MKKRTSSRRTRQLLSELRSLALQPDNAIDTSDAPELADWSGARRGLFFRPVMPRRRAGRAAIRKDSQERG
jgi:hypothetical protein